MLVGRGAERDQLQAALTGGRVGTVRQVASLAVTAAASSSLIVGPMTGWPVRAATSSAASMSVAGTSDAPGGRRVRVSHRVLPLS